MELLLKLFLIECNLNKELISMDLKPTFYLCYKDHKIDFNKLQNSNDFIKLINTETLTDIHESFSNSYGYEPDLYDWRTEVYFTSSFGFDMQIICFYLYRISNTIVCVSKKSDNLISLDSESWKDIIERLFTDKERIIKKLFKDFKERKIKYLKEVYTKVAEEIKQESLRLISFKSEKETMSKTAFHNKYQHMSESYFTYCIEKLKKRKEKIEVEIKKFNKIKLN